MGLGRTLIYLGLMLVAIGLLFSYSGKISWLGHLPGDIYFHRGRFSFYFPLTTCLLISIVITVIMYLFRR